VGLWVKGYKLNVIALRVPRCYGTSLAIWDHTVLLATRHKWMHQAWPQPKMLVHD